MHLANRQTDLFIGMHHTLVVFSWSVDKNNVYVAAIEIFGCVPVSGKVDVATA
ncbi:hypothetical protein D9M71_819100 [compost metagenome]